MNQYAADDAITIKGILITMTLVFVMGFAFFMIFDLLSGRMFLKLFGPIYPIALVSLALNGAAAVGIGRALRRKTQQGY